MLVLAFFSMIFVPLEAVVDIFDSFDVSLISNGSTTSATFIDTAGGFSFDPLIQALTWITVIIILAGVVGFNVVGTGLNSTSAKMIIIGTAWITTFIFLSLFAYPLIVLIPSFFGEILFIFLTIIYAFGVFKQLGDSA